MVGDDDQGVGKVELVGAGLESSGVISFVPLLLGRTVKGCIYASMVESESTLIFLLLSTGALTRYTSLFIYKHAYTRVLSSSF